MALVNTEQEFTQENLKKSQEKLTKQYEILNGYPMYPAQYVFDGRCTIFERIGWDDSIGPTYLAVGPEQEELLLRIGKKNLINKEYQFLKKMEEQHKYKLFSQVHSFWNSPDYEFLLQYFREGPTLPECFSFCGEKFSYGTAAQLSKDILKILKTVHEHGYLLCNVNPECFHFCATNRSLFLADCSYIRKSAMEIPESQERNKWEGSLDYMPVAYKELYSLPGELQAFFYLTVSFVKKLPWQGLPAMEVMWTKVKEIETKNFLQDLPKQYGAIFDIIMTLDGEVTPTEYDKIYKLFDEISINAGLTSEEENLDFERWPDPDELPRIIMEKK